MLQKLELLFLLAIRNVTRNVRRSSLTLAAITVGIISSISLAALARGVSEQMVQDTIDKLTGHVQIHAPGYLDDPSVDHSFDPTRNEIQELMQLPQVKAWSSRVRVPGVVSSERESFGVSIVGTSLKDENELSFIGKLNNRSIGKNDIIVGKALLRSLKTEIGKRIVVATQHVDGSVADRGFRISATFDAELDSTEKSFVFINRDTAKKMLGFENQLSEISVALNNRDEIPRYLNQLKAELKQLEVKRWEEVEPLVVSMSEMQDGFLYLWFGIVITTIAFGLVNTLFMAIFERSRELGLIQALGMRPGLILWQILAESGVLLIVGSAIGTLLSFVVVYLLRDGIDVSAFSSGTEMIGMSSVIYPVLLYKDVLSANLLVVLIGGLSSIYPAFKASHYLPARSIG